MPTKENIELLRRYAELRGELNKFVYLRANEHGDRYIEYAFIPGAPHDNTCLSWYNKMQVHALLRNGHNIKDWKVIAKWIGINKISNISKSNPIN